MSRPRPAATPTPATTRFYVYVVGYDDETAARRLGPHDTERSAERVDGGLNINLDHDRYYTAIETTPDAYGWERNPR